MSRKIRAKYGFQQELVRLSRRGEMTVSKCWGEGWRPGSAVARSHAFCAADYERVSPFRLWRGYGHLMGGGTTTVVVILKRPLSVQADPCRILLMFLVFVRVAQGFWSGGTTARNGGAEAPTRGSTTAARAAIGRGLTTAVAVRARTGRLHS